MTTTIRLIGGLLGALCISGALALNAADANASALNPPLGSTVHADSAAVHSDSTSAEGGLVVSPRSALFDVTLTRGQQETRTAHLTNTGPHTMRITLAAAVTDHAGDRGSTDQLTLSASRGGCVAESNVALTGGNKISQGVLEPGETATVCIAVGLDVDAAPAPPGSVTANLTFDAIASPDSLAATGANTPALLLGIAGGLLLTASVLLRRPAASPEHTAGSTGMSG
ncbi:hypothetical protein J7E45_09395 [Microbacterium sp. ISL-59]|uniref:hypothetical protein n=1 Tax=Microbacterium sp. ISL-59 TaxID=2819159 RepID=UPI001BE5BA27|nr:hypothetical protein [Microbacterium sp. ISL-59]MBT2495822.1 hypothetical protein [Microbacterium sp. ISL-59]